MERMLRVQTVRFEGPGYAVRSTQVHYSIRPISLIGPNNVVILGDAVVG